MSMHVHTVDYRRRGRPHARVDLGFWVGGLPRLLVACRVLGHRPVVDGYGPTPPGTQAARWVACDRCGTRPRPQGDLDPAVWRVGERYVGPFDGAPTPPERSSVLPSSYHRPGDWPEREAWTLSGRLVLLGGQPGFGVTVEVGSAGNEHVLSGHVQLGWLGSLYLATDRLGTWWQRRLNATGYEAKAVEVCVRGGRLRWRLWAPLDYGRDTPWWRAGVVRCHPLDLLLGAARWTHVPVGEVETGAVVLPEGDVHQVTLRLQRAVLARPRGRVLRQAWEVDWEAVGAGIPTRSHGRGRVSRCGVVVPAAAVEGGRWVEAALEAVAQQISEDRASHNYTPE